jgi:AraC-like DNA-binding protein
MNTMYLRYFSKDASFPFCIQFGFHDSDLFMHDHADFSELTIVLSGTALHRVNKEAYVINKGDVFVISNNTIHGFENPHDFRICNIMYRPERLMSSELDIKKSAGFHALFVIEPYLTMERSFQSRLKLQLNEFEEVHSILKNMVKEYELKKEGWKTIVNSNFMVLVIMLSRLYSLPSSGLKPEVINIAKTVSYIENHYIDPISIQQLADMSNLSVRHYTRIFRDTYHTSPGKYILSLKLQHACMLLNNTDLSISEIAYHSGFNDSNYFTRLFKNFFHRTPTSYRITNSLR